MLLTDYFEAVFVENNSRQGMNFLRKFNHFMRFRAFRSDIFLTLRLLQNNLEAYPFCSELRLSVYQPPASAIFHNNKSYQNVYVIAAFLCQILLFSMLSQTQAEALSRTPCTRLLWDGRSRVLLHGAPDR